MYVYLYDICVFDVCVCECIYVCTCAFTFVGNTRCIFTNSWYG